MKLCKNYINGEWVDSVSGKTAPTYNPATGEVLAEMVVSTPEDVDLAVAAARTSFYETRDWQGHGQPDPGGYPPEDCRPHRQVPGRTGSHRVHGHGQTRREAQGDVDAAMRCYRYYAG